MRVGESAPLDEEAEALLFEALRRAWADLTQPGARFELERLDLFGESILAYRNAPTSMRDVWLDSRACGDRTAFVYGDERWSYSEAHSAVGAVAGYLFEQGLRPGDRVAIALRNHPEWMFAYWAAVSSGLTVVGLNAWWSGPEMAYAIQDSRPRVLICDEERLERWLPHQADVPDLPIVCVRTERELPPDVTPWSEMLEIPAELPDVSIDPDADACIFYTSGTTGRPKGAQLTHRGCTNNLMSIAFWSAAHAAARAYSGEEPRVADPQSGSSRQAALLITTPLFHVTANNCMAQNGAFSGAKVVLMPKWDAGEALRLIEQERITSLSGVPVMGRELLAHPDYAQSDTSSLVTLSGGGAPIAPEFVRRVALETTATPRTGYGMTETCGIITANIGGFYVAKPESVGPAMPCFETRCVDEEGHDVPPGESGELWVRGAQVIRGYLDRPEATSEAITGGWLHTGDIARIDDDGFIFIVDRAKDMLLRGGENIYPAEVEATLYAYPGIGECAVFGVPDERLGEEVGAAIVAADGASIDIDGLRRHCAKALARHKVPRYVWILEEPLPRNAAGKFLKRTLRDQLDPNRAI